MTEMRAAMDMPVDTLFGNRVSLKVEVELDTPDELTNRMVTVSMVRTLMMMLEEIRAENERQADADAARRERTPAADA